MDPELEAYVQQELQAVTAWRAVGPAVLVRFPLANTSYEVRHLLGEVPDGFELKKWDARIKATPGALFTKELAYLQADMANATAIVVFGVLREAPIDVNA